MKNIYLLGATGSIGTQTLDILKENKDLFTLIGVSLGTDDKKNKEILNSFNIEVASLRTNEKISEYQKEFPNTTFVFGDLGLNYIAKYDKPGLVINALSGSIGLIPTVDALYSKKDVALANKESLVMAGKIIKNIAKKNKVHIYPIDSEHSAIWQLLKMEKKDDIKKIVITASGGALRDKKRSELENITKEEALNHPNWQMGPKITIDSATMANKCLEIIEAHYLFDLPVEKIETVIHKESIVHGLVYFKDNTVKASLGTPDMRIPISYAICAPNRLKNNYAELELEKLTFSKMDEERFPLIPLVYDCIREGGLLPTVFNAANEAAVKLFLADEIKFLDIERIIIETVKSFKNKKNPALEEIITTNLEIQQEINEKYRK